MSNAARIVMIADDLSGAADCAVSCAVQGLRAFVQVSEMQHPDVAAQVLAIDAATRSMTANRAVATVSRLVAQFNGSRPPVLFKKLDSLLRGHIGPELAAMRCEQNPAVIIMAPALPAQGRTTIDGCQWLYGQRMANANAPKMLQDAGLPSAVIDLTAVRAPARELAKTMAGLACHYDALVCDAETETDLRAVAMAIATLPDAGWAGSIVWAGSSGLARHIPNVMGIADVSIAVEDPPFRGPILLVVGSRSPLAHEQACAAGTADGMITVLLAPHTLREGRDCALGDALESGCDVMAVIDTSDEMAEDPRLSVALAASVSPHIDKVGALIATGGETARAVLIESGITGLRLLREVEPGVPLAVSAGRREIPVITKSGSFGADGTLAHCVQVLRGLRLE